MSNKAGTSRANQSDPHDPVSLLVAQPSEHTFLLSQNDLGNVSSTAIEEDDFNGTTLSRHRSRLNSHPIVNEPEEWLKRNPPDNTRSSASSKDEVSSDSKYLHVSPARFWLVFMTVLGGYFVACFDVTLMASVHPVITSYFGHSNLASWLTTAFMITNTGFQAVWGRLSDSIGRKTVYIVVLLVFALANLWCGLSQSIGSFIAARAVCGIGAGGTMSMGLVTTNDLVKIEYRGTYISYINAAFGFGAASGAAFGGVIADTIGWRWAFGVQVPIILACAAAALFTVPNGLGPQLISQGKGNSRKSPAWKAITEFDSLGVVTLVLAVASLILFLNFGGNQFAWDHPVVITCFVLSILLSIAVVWVESRALQPIMPLYLLTKHPYANLVYSNFLAGVASNTVLFNAPLWFQAVDLDSPSTAGLRLTAPAMGGAIAGVVTGYIITYSQRLKPMLLVGGGVYLVGSCLLWAISQDMSLPLQTFLVTPTPLSQGFVYPASMMSAFAVSSTDDQAVVTTTLSLWRNLGIVAGVAISSLVFQNALWVQLQQHVRGPRAAEFIAVARNNVRQIESIPEPYRGQVIESYAVALKLSFLTATVASVILVIITVPMKLPRLKYKISAAAGE